MVNIIRKSLFIIVSLILVLLSSPIVPNVSAQIEEYVSPEAMLFMEIPTVITAAKREQAITEAPAAMTVITAEDIKQSGATLLGEVLRMVPGVHMGYATAGNMEVGGIRGFNIMPPRKAILLIDGIPWVYEVTTMPMFNYLPIALEEIERIEILRGPGSSLYGPDAMFGIVNLITKKPNDTQGSMLSLTGGELETRIGTYLYGGSVKDKINYRISLSHDDRDNWSDGFVSYLNNPINRYLRGNANIDWAIDDNSEIILSGSYIDRKQWYSFSPGAGPYDLGNDEAYLASVTYASKEPDMILRAYLRSQAMSTDALGVPIADITMGTKIIEFQHTLELLEQDILVWGGNFTTHNINTTMVGGKRRHDLRGIFVDNTYKFQDNLSLNTGLRYDHHPNAGDSLSHRLALLYSPWQKHHFRFSYSSAFRNPDFMENYLYLATAYYDVYGYEDNKPEQVETLELGYKGDWTNNFQVEANVFYTKLIDPIYYKVSPISIIPTAPYIHWTEEYRNIADAAQIGTEIEMRYLFNNWLSVLINHTNLEQWEDEGDANTYALVAGTPQNMVNAQLRAYFDNGFSANISALYRGSTFWTPTYTWCGYIPDPRGTTIGGGKTSKYIITNLRLGYKFFLWENPAEVSLAVFNLFKKGYDDYPMDTSSVGRRITGTFTCKF
ncbi:MAG: TonB-dependent receptor [Candidatus Omnitrophota bacterium]